MGAHTKLAVVLVVLGTVGIVIWRALQPELVETRSANVSDAADRIGHIEVGMDGWVGYYPLCSPEMRDAMHDRGYGFECIDDAADTDQRFAKLARGELDYAVATLDSYLTNGADRGFPGVIVAVIDESKGGDALVAWPEVVPNLEVLKTNEDVRLGYTPDSPSEHLLRAVESHFDVPKLRTRPSVRLTDGAADALAKLTSRELDAAVLWEPEVSRALAAGAVRLLDTSEMRDVIVDVLIASPQSVGRDGEIGVVLKTYFEALATLRGAPARLEQGIASAYDVDTATARTLLDGVAWASLSANTNTWFATGDGAAPRLISALDDTVSIFSATGDAATVDSNDTYRFVNSSFVESIRASLDHEPQTAEAIEFEALSDAQWALLEDVGSLKTLRITFASGLDELDPSGLRLVDAAVTDLGHYPRFRIEVRGHTGTRGDDAANMRLSKERAAAVREYLTSRHGIPPARIRAVGFGGAIPLDRLPDESNRAYNYRLPRVEIALVREVL